MARLRVVGKSRVFNLINSGFRSSPHTYDSAVYCGKVFNDTICVSTTSWASSEPGSMVSKRISLICRIQGTIERDWPFGFGVVSKHLGDQFDRCELQHKTLVRLNMRPKGDRLNLSATPPLCQLPLSQPTFATTEPESSVSSAWPPLHLRSPVELQSTSLKAPPYAIIPRICRNHSARTQS